MTTMSIEQSVATSLAHINRRFADIIEILMTRNYLHIVSILLTYTLFKCFKQKYDFDNKI